MDLRRKLLLDAWLQLLLVAVIVVLANTWVSRRFFRLDLTRDRIYSLDMASRALMYKLDRPLVARVYFTEGLQPPYHDHKRAVVDKLRDFAAYSHGLMEIRVEDPTYVKELQEEARRFGIEPIDYRYRSANVTELKKVWMGVALAYGDRLETIPAITRLDTLEYEIARAVHALLAEGDPPVIGWATGHGEPDLFGKAPAIARLREKLAEDYQLRPVELGGPGEVPEDVDALLVVGPRRPLGERSIWQLDQFVLRGGALGVFVTQVVPDMRTMRPRPVYHGLEAFLAHLGVRVNRDVVVDRRLNGTLRVPFRRGRALVSVPVNHPLLPRTGRLDAESPLVRGLDTLLFPFVSSLELVDPLPPDVEARVLAWSSEASGRIRGIRTVDPRAYQLVAPGEERGSFPLMVALTGRWRTAFPDRDRPPPPETGDEDEAAAEPPIREGTDTRVVVAGSADMVANNLAFMLNLADWLVQDEALISIRSKTVQLPQLDPVPPERLRIWRAVDIGSGIALLLAFGLVRWVARRRRAARVARALDRGEA